MADERESFLRITEIFHSVQGESTWAGLPCTFVRITGCPLRCTWCDTEYAFHGGTKTTFDEILAEVERLSAATGGGATGSLVEVTGGEPLAHPGAFDLIGRLCDEGYTVLVETSGAFDVEPVDDRAHLVMDLKCPGSGEVEKNLWANLDHLRGKDEIKFVVKDRADYEWMRGTIAERGLDSRVAEGSLRALLVSPVWGEIDLESLAGWVLEDGLPVRYQIQLHKLIWGADTKGV